VQDYPRVPAARDPLVDQQALTTRAWYRFFSDLSGAIAIASTETFVRVQNSTGVTLPKGTVVGFAGVGANDYISVAPYLADGSTPSLYILGVMAETVPDNGATGLCCVWGNVSDIDTSAFSAGDILYASPTVAGAFTATKPTAPDNVIPVAAVLIDSATAGVVFVRPTIEQQKYYGEFSLTSNLTAALTNTAYPIPVPNVEIANGITVGTAQGETLDLNFVTQTYGVDSAFLDRVTVAESGLYNFTVKYQLASGSGSAKTARFWFRLNGTTDIPNSASLSTISGSSASGVLSKSELLSLAKDDYVQLMWAVSDTALSLAAAPATAYAPASAAVLLIVTQVQQ
jgi:hypothetical protein